jgi:hypothetical protein
MNEPQTNRDIAVPSINDIKVSEQKFPITRYFDLLPPMM